MTKPTKPYIPPATTTTPDLSDPWYAGQVLPQMIPGLPWIVKPEQVARAQDVDVPIMHPDSLARIEEAYEVWLKERREREAQSWKPKSI